MSAHVSLRRQATQPATSRALLAFAITALVAGSAWLVVTAVAPASGRTLVATALGVAALGLCVAVAMAVYSEQENRQARERLAAMDANAARLADDMLPALVKRMRDGASADTALTELPPPAESGQRRVLWAVAQEIGQGERRRAAMMSACASAAGRVQALATSMLADLREMEDRHSEEVLGDLLKLDHSTAQAGRLADSIAVLTGARSGRRWTKPIVMESILRGAVGRIGAYQRVRLHSTLSVAVVGYAAEGVMHALAELMDNAAKFSPPAEQVHVYAEEVHAGVVITIEDGGLAMSASALRRAEHAVSAEPLDLATLSGTRLGLAVVGCLARKHGLTISFRPSSRGGTGVVVMIPRQLITEPRYDMGPALSRPLGSSALAMSPPADDPSAGSGVPVSGVPASGVPASGVPAADASPGEFAVSDFAAGGVPADPGQQAHGLPKRRRGETFAAATRPPSDMPSAPPSAPPSVPPSAAREQPARPRPDAGSRFSAFREASRGGDTSSSGEEAAQSPAADDDTE
ncbi:MAG TPA: ATP-binding protein [Streptosporangiaceae bacterium]|jgi:signal transduction histidine kinase